MPSVISLKQLKKSYKTGDTKTEALRGIDLSIESGEFVAIMGPSGSGKSSLMHIIGLLDLPTSGNYLLNGRDVSTLTSNHQAEIRNQEIGFVFQQFNLLPRTSVLENVLLPSVYSDQKNSVDRAKKLIKQVGLSDRINNLSNQLSGGQIQRVAIARALLMQPSLILADEPTGNLDSETSYEIMEIFKQIHKDGGTIVLITHEPDIAKYAQRIIHLKDGLIENKRQGTK